MTHYETQRTAFWYEEGDKWHDRNRLAPIKQEVLDAVYGLKLPENPTIVEVGCGDGFYIASWQEAFKATAYGLDVSDVAIKQAKILYPRVTFVRNSAHAINRYRADLIVYGFSLYVVDRDTLFDLVAHTNQALNEGGYLAIHDFDPPYPQKVPYHHCDGIFTYKMNYSKLWLANPAYEFVSKTKTREGEAITILKKGDWNKWQ